MHCFIDYRTTDEEINNLLSLDLNVIKVPKTNKVYDAIDGHPDIQMNILKNKSSAQIIVQKDISNQFKKILEENHLKYILSKTSLSNTYPGDVILNSFILDDYFIHNLKSSDENLLKSQSGKKFIHISQGYSKCSILPVRDKALITSDTGIYNTLSQFGFDILLVPPGDILLPSLNYGFIGGTGGMISDNVMCFFGELSNYEHGEKVKQFLYKYDVSHIALRKGKLIDRGSLFVL